MDNQWNLSSLQKKIEELKVKLKSFSLEKNKITTYLLGITGVGKSTFTNYMLGANLTFKKKGPKYFLENGDDERFPQIGNKPSSCTEIPSIYEGQNLLFVDPAGFLDTKGPVQETINAFANAKMFQRGAKTRIILVIEYFALIVGRGGTLVDFAVRLRELFPADFSNIVQSCMILITKANIEETDVQDATSILSQIISSNKNLPSECKMMILTIIQFNKIALFPNPPQITPEIIEDVKEKILSIHECVLSRDASVSLSPVAKTELQNMSSSVINDLKQCESQIVGEIQNKFSGEGLSKSSQIDPLLGRARQALQVVKREMNEGGLESFERFASFISLSTNISERVKKNFDKIDFCRTLNSQFRINLTIFQKIQNSLNECLSKLEFILQKIASKEEIDKMNEMHQNEMALRRQQFNEMKQSMQENARINEEKTKKDLQRQRKDFNQMIKKSNENFQNKFQALQTELADSRRRNEELQNASNDSDGGWCPIM